LREGVSADGAKEKIDMTTPTKLKAEEIYGELEALRKNAETIRQNKLKLEADAKAAREDEVKAKTSVSRALLNGDEASAAAFRQTAKEKAEFADECENAVKEAEAAIKEADRAFILKNDAAERASCFVLHEHSRDAMEKMRPYLKALLDMVAEHDHEQQRTRPGQSRYSTYRQLFAMFVYWFDTGRWGEPSQILKKFDAEMGSSAQMEQLALAEFLTPADLSRLQKRVAKAAPSSGSQPAIAPPQ
jgi:hypothetical protein